MQIIRILVMVAGLAIIATGLYLLVLGLGAPVEIHSIELGLFKASLAGVGAGLVVALVGCVVLWLPMAHMKKIVNQTTETTEESDASGLKKVTKVIRVETQLAPPMFP